MCTPPWECTFFDALWKKDKKKDKSFSELLISPKSANQGPKQPGPHQKCRNSTGIFPTFLRGCKRKVLLQPLIRFCFVFNKPLVFFAKRTLSEGYLRISFTTVFWLL